MIYANPLKHHTIHLETSVIAFVKEVSKLYIRLFQLTHQDPKGGKQKDIIDKSFPTHINRLIPNCLQIEIKQKKGTSMREFTPSNQEYMTLKLIIVVS